MKINNLTRKNTGKAGIFPIVEDHILDLLPAAVYVCNRDSLITYFNKAAVKLWRHTPEIGDPLLKYCASYKATVDGAYIPFGQNPVEMALATGRSFRNVEASAQRPDGSCFQALVSIDPLYNDENEVIEAVVVFQDVTEAKKALLQNEEKYRLLAGSLEKMVEEKVNALRLTAEELRKSEERYHKMIEEIEDYAIILLDTEGIVLNWNKGAERIKGYKEQEIVGKSFQEFYLKEDQQSGLPLQFLNEAREKGKAVYEGWRKRKDGTVFWGSVVLTALHDALGTIIGFSKVTRDLTAKKRAEDRMKAYLAQLEFQNKELDQFVYASSHDLKEPLRKIQLYNSYIASNPNNQMDQKSREYLTRSIQAVGRMNRLIEDLLAYSRITNIREGFETVDLNKLIDEIIAFRKEDIERKNITIHCESLPVINAIPFQINQLMSNLLDNAIKYSDPEKIGNISIEAATVPAKALEATTAPFREYYQISIKDNGIGFEADFTDKVFELFQRLPNNSDVKGSGIGLAICKKIVQNHNGFIKASGNPGVGATFSIYLPVE